MPKKKKSKAPKPTFRNTPQYIPLVPDRFYRRSQVVANRFLGYSDSQLEYHIRLGTIDPPVVLSISGRACGWFGRDIQKMQARFAAKRSGAA
jgi:hypothetical protein